MMDDEFWILNIEQGSLRDARLSLGQVYRWCQFALLNILREYSRNSGEITL